MSTDSIAMLRKTAGKEMAELARRHIEHDLTTQDRETLENAASKVRNHVTIGSLVGLGLGILMAFRIRSSRIAMFNTFKAREKPTHVQFADGRTEPLPDLTSLLRPTLLGDMVTYFFFTAGGLFVGGETGLLTGSYSSGRLITRDPESMKRIDSAFRKFKADVLRRDADVLEGKDGDKRIAWGSGLI